VLISCGPTEPAANALRSDAGEPIYHDGTYRVVGSSTGADGWQPYLEIKVEGAVILSACFGAVRGHGTLLADDGVYAESFKLETGADLSSFLADLESQLVEHQRLPVSVRATALDRRVEWAARYCVFAARALSLAQSGISPLGEVVEPGPFEASDRPDETGWQARLSIVVYDDRIAAAAYEETRLGPTGEVSSRAEDASIAADYERIYGLRPAAVAEELSSQLVGQLLEARDLQIDAVTSATVTTGRLVSLAQSILGSRIKAEVPHRVCR